MMDSKTKICYINGSPVSSTGNIVSNLSQAAAKAGYSCLFVSVNPEKSYFAGQLVNVLPYKYSYLESRLPTFLFDGDGFRSGHATKIAMNAIKSFRPNIVHIHNVHGSYINIDKIADYLLCLKSKIVWTLHDEWSVTGRCGYPFECQAWKAGCRKCLYRSNYPRVVFSQSSKFYIKKRKLFRKLIDAGTVFVSPSQWLLDIFLSCYPSARAQIIRNGIDLNIFNINGPKNQDVIRFAGHRKVIGGASVAASKGGDYFAKIAKKVDSAKYCVVVAGAKQTELVSPNLLYLKKLNSQREMAAYYRSIDVLVSPTQSDNFPTAHLESLSCGSPVLTFKVGGAAEMLEEQINGYSVPLNDLDALMKKLNEMLIFPWDRKKISSSQVLSSDNMNSEYIKLYKSL